MRSMIVSCLAVATSLLSASGCAPSSAAAPVKAHPVAAPVSRTEPAPGEPVALPARFEAGLIWVEPVTKEGVRLRFFTDSGGGRQFVYGDAVERFGWQATEVGEGDQRIRTIAIPEWRAGEGIPDPVDIGAPEGIRGRYLVFEEENPLRDPDEHGFLGQGWWGGRVWTIDYPAMKLWWRAAGDVPAHPGEAETPMSFQREGEQVVAQFPRITVEIDGERLDLLFDTGATTFLTEEACAATGLSSCERRATSFIAANVVERWRERHPDWPWVKNAEKRTGAAMIRVPAVKIANQQVGPVWFTVRPDKAFHQFMSQFMDQRVEGALGGNALGELRVTADYPGGRLIVERPQP